MDLNEAIRLSPKSSTSFNGRGVAYSTKGDYSRAIDDFSQAISLNSGFANAHANRGVAYGKIGLFDQAIADLTTALRIEDNASFNRELAWTFLSAGRPAEGLPYADTALAKDPNSAVAFETCGLIQEALGRRDLARSDFERALALDPKLKSSTEDLSRLGFTNSDSVSFRDVVEFVQRQGWRVDMGDLCDKLGMRQIDNDCIFRQLSVEDTHERSYPRGFNVAARTKDGIDPILLFHLNPLVGEFFLVLPDGALAVAYLRAKGSEYEKVPNDIVRDEFEKDAMYWRKNFLRLKTGLESERSNSKAHP